MTVFAEIILVASAVILSYLLFSLRRHSVPELFFHNLSYDPHSNKLKLSVENFGTKSMHVKPAFRLVHLKSAEEWKNGITEDGIPMMAGREMSLIKGYELLCQLPNSVEVPPQDIQEIEIQLDDGSILQAYDNVRVSILCGKNPIKLTDAVHSTLRVKVDDFGHPELMALEESAKTDDLLKPPDAALVEETKKPSIRKRVVRNGFPIDAMCVCCGQPKWLKWVVDGQHVCVECRDFLYDKIKEEYPEEEVDLDLTERQRKIVEYIDGEGELDMKRLCHLVGKSRSTVNKELKILIETGVVEKRKDKNRNYYGLA